MMEFMKKRVRGCNKSTLPKQDDERENSEETLQKKRTQRDESLKGQCESNESKRTNVDYSSRIQSLMKANRTSGYQ